MNKNTPLGTCHPKRHVILNPRLRGGKLREASQKQNDEILRYTQNDKGGFTLVEVSIVMVIIGLILAGVVKGRGLLRSAAVTSVIKDVQEYQYAVEVFSDKYSALPGDFNNTDANTTWPVETPGGGDGDGQIAISGEDVLAWRHLQLAEMIAGNYTGALDGTAVTPGVNLPESKIDTAGYWLRFFGAVFTTTNRHFFVFGTKSADFLDGAIVSAPEAWSIDQKIDDGEAATGDVMTQDGSGVTGCLDLTPTPNEYNLTTELIRCQMFFLVNQ